MILVIGATGKVGRHVVSGLLEEGATLSALARDPKTAGLPEPVDVICGDLSDVDGLEKRLPEAEAVFLVWPFLHAERAAEVVDMLAARAGRIVYLSAEAAADRPNSFWATVERSIERSGVPWTFLRPTGFAANTLMWAEQIRRGGVVRWPYGQAARSLIHERDIGAVGVRALIEDGHDGERYVLTGPETITQAEQVGVIGQAIGRTVRWEELSREEVKDQLAGIPDGALDTWASFVRAPEIVTSTVREITGEPARSFAHWARDHAQDFR